MRAELSAFHGIRIVKSTKCVFFSRYDLSLLYINFSKMRLMLESNEIGL